jgi:hypothetical protein
MSAWIEKQGMVTIPTCCHVEKLEWIMIPYAMATFPLITDELFSEKLTQFADFNIKGIVRTPHNQKDVEEIADQMCNLEFELSTYQTSIRNFLSNDTPYNGLLLFHGLGTGKTCSAITVAEEHRKFLKQSGLYLMDGGKRREKRIYILGGPNIKSNFKKQLFDPLQLYKSQGEWKCKRCCLGNALLREVNPTNLNLPKDELIQRIQDVIRRYYKFMGYIEFANMVRDLKRRSPNAIAKEFEHCMIVIDEVHNIKSDDSDDKFTASKSIDIITKKTTVKLLFLSATPMFNEPSEIVWITNMLNQNDKKPVIVEGDFFKDGMLIESQKENFIHHIRGYVSFVKGENPYTFPYRIYPDLFDNRGLSLPTIGIDDTSIGPLKTRIYPVQLSDYQAAQYMNKIKTMDSADVKNFTLNTTLLASLNITYPNDVSELSHYMKKRDRMYEYYPERIKCFDRDHIQTYSAKIHAICNHIEHSTGIVLIYSRLLPEGVYPMAMALESMGYGNVDGNILSKRPSTKKYCLITGESNSSNNAANIKRIKSPENINGDEIKVVIITAAASEGVDFYNIRQIHIMDPWWHLNRNEQIIGRGIRLCSHKSLPFEQRNAQIFLYVSLIGEKEAFDYYLYRYAEEKASKIGKISRLLKENAMDCAMNHTQFQSVENMNLKVNQIISTGEKIKYSIGDNSYSVMCDFMDCTYQCTAKEHPILYQRQLFDMNRTIEQIRSQFNHGYAYTVQDLFRELNIIAPMTYDQLYEALSQMVELKMGCRDMTNRSGYIVNYGKYYLFQPNQLPGAVPVNERRIPSNQIYHSIIVETDAPVLETNIGHMIETMRGQYEMSQSNASGEGWYSMVSSAKTHILQTMRESKRIGPSERLDDTLFNQCIIDHMIELLLYNPCIDLLNHLFFNELSPFEEQLKSYFKVQNGILRIWDNTKIVHLKTYQNKWVKVVATENNPPKRDFGTVVGGIANNNEDERVFKSKSMKQVSDSSNITYGQICIQASLGTGAHDRIAEVLGIPVSFYKKIQQKAICCELELLLRYLQKVGPKIWFLSAVEVLENNEQITSENNASVVNFMKNRKVNIKK